MIDTLAVILISPLNQFLFGSILGMSIIRFVPKTKTLGKFLIIISGIWLFLCSQFFFSHWLISPLENVHKPLKLNDPKWKNADGMWVLACYHFDAPELPLVSQFNHCSLERLVHAANMYRIMRMPIFLSGADFVKSSSTVHAEQAAKLLVSLGVNKEDIILIPKGTNTYEEAEAIYDNTESLSLAVISSATHGKRISMVLTKLGLDYTFIPVHYSKKGDIVYRLHFPSIQALERSERAMYEYAAILKYSILY